MSAMGGAGLAAIDAIADASRFNLFNSLIQREGIGERVYHDPFRFMKLWHFELANMFESDALACLFSLREGRDIGISLLNGLPIDSVIPTGESALARNAYKTRVSEAVILSMATLMGCYLYSKPTEQEGVIVHNVSPVKGKEHVVSSVGRDPFYYHTEIAYASAVPRFLMLFCLEGDVTARTSYFFINQIMEGIPEEIKALMRLPIFKLGAVTGYTTEETVTPILSVDSITGVETFRFYQEVSRIKPAFAEGESNEQALHCLGFLESHAKEVFPVSGEEPSIGLRPGQALLFNNGWTSGAQHYGVMHGRVGYITNPSRWLQRGYFFEMTGLEKSAANLGYASYLWELIKDKDFPIGLAVTCLKKAIQETPTYKRMLGASPGAPLAWLFLHSVNVLPRLGRVRDRYKTESEKEPYAACRIQRAYCFHRSRTQDPWLARVAREAEFVTVPKE